MDEKLTIKAEEVINHLKNLDKTMKETGKWLVWVTFPYSSDNLKVVENSLKILDWKKSEYRLNYDENQIFIEKDILMEDD